MDTCCSAPVQCAASTGVPDGLPVKVVGAALGDRTAELAVTVLLLSGPVGSPAEQPTKNRMLMQMVVAVIFTEVVIVFMTVSLESLAV